MSKTILFSICLMTIISVGCQRTYTPKPRGYFRISLPDKEYQSFDTTYPYKFDYPTYSKVITDSSSNAEAYWINLEFPQFDGKIHMSYKTINNNLFDLLEDSRSLAYKHAIKADAINEKLFFDETKNVFGILYNIEGDAASPVQFFATDSTRHFLRGSLYFYSVPNKDSLAPVVTFVREDIMRLMESLQWKESIK